jgi:hypothetical protein
MPIDHDDDSPAAGGSDASASNKGASSTAFRGPRFQRRTFLGYLGVGAAAFVDAACEPGGGNLDAIIATLPHVTAWGLRREDLVALKFTFVNFQLDASSANLLNLASGGGAPAALVVLELAPQHLLERAFQETNAPLADAPPIDARIAGTSRLVFRVPNDVKTLPYSLSSILETCRKLPPVVSTNAAPADPTILAAKPSPSPPANALTGTGFIGNLRTGQGLIEFNKSSGVATVTTADLLLANEAANPQKVLVPGFKVGPLVVAPTQVAAPKPGASVAPNQYETALEVPFRVVISPNASAQWEHAPNPVTSAASVVGAPIGNVDAAAGPPLIQAGRSELWHTRLGVRPDAQQKAFTHGYAVEDPSALRSVRVLATRGDAGAMPAAQCGRADSSSNGNAFPNGSASLAQAHRQQLVKQTSDFSNGAKPLPVHVRRLMLSSLGAWFDAHGEWTGEPLECWDHQATLGRDHYVKIVARGRLYPWRHAASLVTVTERKLRTIPNASGNGVGYLWQRSYLVIREPTHDYGSLPVGWQRQLPFKSLTFKTLVTPDLSTTNAVLKNGAITTMWLEVDDLPFLLPAEAIDHGGKTFHLNVPAIWLASCDAASEADNAEVARCQFALFSESRTTCKLAGQRIAFAPQHRPDDTAYEVESIVLGSYLNAGNFAPSLLKANLSVNALRHLANGPDSASFHYHTEYLNHGFVQGTTEVLLVADTPIKLTFSNQSDKSGGLVSPDTTITGLTRTTGPTGATLTDGSLDIKPDDTFVADQYFPRAGITPAAQGIAFPKLFGVFELIDLLGVDAIAPVFSSQTLNAIEDLLLDLDWASKLFSGSEAIESSSAAILALVASSSEAKQLSDSDGLGEKLTELAAALEAQLPNATTPDASRRLRALLAALRTSKMVDAFKAYAAAEEMLTSGTIRLDWQTTLTDALGVFDSHENTATLTLAVEVRTKQTEGKSAGTDVSCIIKDFGLNLIDKAKFMTLQFDRVAFIAEAGKKPDVDVVMAGSVGFDGILAFVEALQSVIPADGFSDPPALSVTSAGIEASFSIGIPSISIGIFAIENMSLGAGFKIPFIGDPLSVSFNFCKREEPFHIIVSMLGGGGFFGVTVNPNGVYLLEAALEFGAELALDFGVASGCVSIMAGIYFKWQKVPGAELTGYLRIRGEVEVLGLISASIEMRMELTYEFDSGKVIGRASIDVEVHVVFFSASVSVSCERKFAGSNDDPSFAQVMSPCDTPASGDLPLLPQMPSLVDGKWVCADGGTDALGQPLRTEPLPAWTDYIGAFA